MNNFNIASFSSTPCWTCRRRRVKCDRGIPECQRCLISEEVCQGYSANKPLRWSNGVASRGKLKGKSLPLPDTNTQASLKISLTDPVMQDLSLIDRQYIKYFDRYCSIESTLYEFNITNPFREFIRLIPSSTALPHTMISVAALHQSRRKSLSKSTKMETSPTVTNSAGLFTTRTVIQEDPHALYDCLKHKQYALKQIQKDILNAGHQNIEGTIASMLLLVWQDLMDSGKDSWKYHLNALRKTAQLQKFSKSSSGISVSFGFRGLEDYLEMTYAALHILGTTFIQSKDPYQPLFSTLPTQDMTKLSDGEVWAGCPGEILHIISSINDISRTQSSPAGPATQIMLDLTAFSPIKWAVGSSQPNLMKSRYHLATVYKHSAMIYLHQVFHQLPRLSDAKMTDPGSLDSAVLHIQSISPKDPHFKSLVWPAFVIGAEIKIEAHKLVITQTFEQLCDIWRCQNVSNALNVLQNLWKRDNEIPDFIPWIGEIHRSGMDWIFV